MSGLRRSHSGNPHRPYKSPARERGQTVGAPYAQGGPEGRQHPGLEGLDPPGRDEALPIGARRPEELMLRGEGAARPSHLIRGTPRDGKTASGAAPREDFRRPPRRERPETPDARPVGRTTAAEGRARLSRGS